MKKSIGAYLVYGLVIMLVIWLFTSTVSSNAKKSKIIEYSTLIQMIDNGEIYSVGSYNDNGNNMIVAIRKDTENADKKTQQDIIKYADYIAYAPAGSAQDSFVKTLETALESGKIATLTFLPYQDSSWIISIIPYAMLGLLMIGLLVFIYQQSQGNNKAMQFGKSTARMYVDGKDKVDFSCVAGADEEKYELSEIVDFLKNPTKYAEAGARIPKGILLVGPPGTGKTLLAKAVAGEASVPFFSITGSDFVELYVGVGASRVRDLFAQAKKHAPCIIFIDEIDAVGRRRGAGLGGGHDEREQTLNQLLVEMDGFNVNSGIIVMAATNRADILDPALLRSGRFDRQIHVMMPDVKGREEIFKVHARNKKLDPKVNPKEIAKLTTGFTGADIENLLNEAALLAVRNNRKLITNQDLKDAITKVVMGPEKKSRLVTERDRKITAYHEAGHALTAKLLPHCDPISEISIVGRGAAAGYTMTLPGNDDQHMSKNKMIDTLSELLGGRVAEELVIKDVSTGASSDIKRVTELAHAMVTQYGMHDEIGPVYLGGGEEVFIGSSFTSQKQYSDSWAAKIDEAVHSIIDKAHNRTRQLLQANINALHKIANALLEKEKINGDELDKLLEGEELVTFNEANANA